MEAREMFEGLINDFAAASGIDVQVNEDGAAVINVGDVIVNLQFLEESAHVMSWATLGFLGDDENADLRVAHLLKLNDTPSVTGGYVFSFDRDDDNRVLVHDIRPIEFLESADRLAAWVEVLVDLIESVTVKLNVDYPYVDDNDDDFTFELVEE